MADDRKNPGMSLCSDKAVRSGLARLKRCTLAVICFLLSVFCTLAVANGISTNKAEMRLTDNGYQLSANYGVNLTYAVQQALSRGVPLYFVGEFSIMRSRWYWLDEEVFHSEQTVKLSYNVLTRQYRISRGALFQNFASFEDAMNILSRQSSGDIPAEMLKKGSNYTAAARLRLDIAQLPKLLQVNALTSKDWSMDSDWYRWLIRPAELTVNNEGKTE